LNFAASAKKINRKLLAFTYRAALWDEKQFALGFSGASRGKIIRVFISFVCYLSRLHLIFISCGAWKGLIIHVYASFYAGFNLFLFSTFVPEPVYKAF
jgi:hypothetical protein